MKIRGFVAVLVVVMAVVFFVFFAKMANEKSGLETQVDKSLESRVELTRTALEALAAEVTSFAAENGIPEKLAELRRLRPQFTVPLDGWGREIAYERVSDASFRLLSAGPDGKFRTEDDIIKEY
jgi:hypothetical protein